MLLTINNRMTTFPRSACCNKKAVKHGPQMFETNQTIYHLCAGCGNVCGTITHVELPKIESIKRTGFELYRERSKQLRKDDVRRSLNS